MPVPVLRWWKAIIIVLLLAVPASAMACVATTGFTIGRSSPPYVFSGRYHAVMDWQPDGFGRSRVLFNGCTPGQELVITISAELTGLGKHDGFMTYATNVDWMGVQFRVAIGEKPFIDIDSLRSGLVYPVPSGTSQLYVQVQYRYVALTESPGTGHLDAGAVFTYRGSDGGSGSASVNASLDMLYPYVPPPPPSCSFKAFKRSIDLGRLHVSQLRNVGDKGPAHLFNWGYSCNSSVSSAEVRYSADGIIDANAGTFAVTGGAKGVALELRRGVNGSNEGTPVKFNAPYRLGTGSVTERMSVRYVRTGDVTAGDANGSLKIRLDYY